MADAAWRAGALALRTGAVTPEAFSAALGDDQRVRIALMRALYADVMPAGAAAVGLLEQLGDPDWTFFEKAVALARRMGGPSYIQRGSHRLARGEATPGSCVDLESWGAVEHLGDDLPCALCEWDPVDGRACPCGCATCAPKVARRG